MQSIHYLFLIISVTNAVPFTLTSGDGCELVDHSGKQCFQSQNYPANYDNSKVCTITMNQAGFLNAVAFDVEKSSLCNADYMKITVTTTATNYCGSIGPDNIEVTNGDTVEWKSDCCTTKKGFMICYREPICQNFNGLTINDKPCSCGSSDCTSNNGLFCAKGISRCSTAPTNSCSNVNGNVANINSCQCGATSDCETATGMFCFSDYDFCKPHSKCTDIYGSTENDIDCTCGSAHCDASTGRFCKQEYNQCGPTLIAKDGFTSNDELKQAVNLYLSDVGNVVDFVLVDQVNKDKSIGKYGEVPEWDVSRITSMKEVFSYVTINGKLTTFSGSTSGIIDRAECCDLSKWNVGKTTDFFEMFRSTFWFNSDLSKW